MPLVSQERLRKDIRRVLENPCLIPELETDELYVRIHDDTDGTLKGSIGILLDQVGDARITFNPPYIGFSLRFRNYFGGGMSPRTRNALAILALAIKLDNEEKPQQ